MMCLPYSPVNQTPERVSGIGFRCPRSNRKRPGTGILIGLEVCGMVC